jgi:hypothetical protein
MWALAQETIAADGVASVVLLMMNTLDEGGFDDCGFAALADRCLRWAIRSGLGPRRTVSQADLGKLADRLDRSDTTPARAPDHPLDSTTILEFLKNNFDIHIRRAERGAEGEPAEATVFPMLPWLSARPAGAKTWRKYASYQRRGEAYERWLAWYFREPVVGIPNDRPIRSAAKGSKPQQPSSGGRRPQASKSMASILLEDYFAVLMAALVERAIHTLEQQKRDEVTVDELVQLMMESEGIEQPAFADAAGMATRILLHGLRVPPKIGAGERPLPLFQLAGQQFPVELHDGEWWVHLRKAPNAPVELTLPAGERQFRIEFDEDAIAELDTDVTISAEFERPPTVGRSGESYSLDRAIRWVDDCSVRPFPPNLIAALAAQEKLEVEVGEDLTGSAWAMRLELPIRRIPGIDGIVEVGSISEAARLQLERLRARHKVQVVYRDGSEWAQASGVVLVKTNLTTESAPSPPPPSEPTAVAAAAPSTETSREYVAHADTDAADFVDLVRQLAVVKGSGFYLLIPDPPDDLLDQNSNAKVTLLIHAGAIRSELNGTEVPRGTNAILTDIAADQSISFTAVNREVWSPVLEPGTVAFDLVRDVPPEHDYLQSLFHLVEHRIQPSKLGSTRWSVPVGPTEPEDAAQRADKKWRYHHVVDAHLHKRGPDDSSKAGRYATVGSTIRIDLKFLDPFGNRAPNSKISDGPPTIKLPILYTDRIIPISEWPGASLVHRLNSRTRRLIVELTFDPAVLADTDETDNSELRAEVRRLYEKVFNQLHGRGVSVTLETSLAGVESGTTQLRSKLRDFVADAIRAIDNDSAAPVRTRISRAITASADWVRRIQQVRVAVVIARSAEYVDDLAAEKMPLSRSAATAARPDLGAGGDPSARLVAFAKAFEAIYPGVKVATGEGDKGTLELWAVPLSRTELRRKRVAPEFFAPRPLSTTLVNGAVAAPDGTPLSLVDVDLDEWAAKFMAHVDDALAADQLEGWLDSDAALLDDLLGFKRKIADAIADGVASVLTPRRRQTAALKAAQRTFRSRVRRRLRAASDVETAVWLSLRAPNLTEPGFVRPRLYGTVVSVGTELSAAGAGPAIALSSAKVTMSTSSEVSFLFDTTTPEQARSVPLELALNITHVEHEIARGGEDYGSSSWLTLVLPETNVPLGADPIEVPVPLRRHPVPPALVRQSTEASHSEPTTLAEAASWDYRVAYRSAASPQDTLGLHVQFNDRGASHATAESGATMLPKDSLPGALACYFAEFADGFDAGRREGFVARVAEVADAWPVPQEGSRGRAGLPADFVTYDVIETRRRGNKPAHIIEVAHVDGLELDRGVTLDGNHPLPVDDGRLVFTKPKGSWAQRVREFELTGLDVRVHENARAHLEIRRNEDLLDDRETNSLFVYRTPVVRFDDEVTPLLGTARTLPISRQNKPIEGHLRDFFDELLDPVAEESARPISLGVVYRYAIDCGGKREMVLPLIQVPAFAFEQLSDFDGEGAFTTRLASWLSNWQSTERPAGRHARFEFEVRVFAVLSKDVDLPVLRLGRLVLPLDQITA